MKKNILLEKGVIVPLIAFTADPEKLPVTGHPPKNEPNILAHDNAMSSCVESVS